MFKKSMAAFAVLSLSAGLASASEVTLYGIVDNGLLYKHSKVEADGVSKKTDSFALETPRPASASRVPKILATA